MDYKKLMKKFKKATEDFNLIEDGDKIAIGISGGKDSLTLLYLLSIYKKISPKKFDLVGISLDPGNGCDFSSVEILSKKLNIEYHIIPTDISNIVFNIKKEKNPCSLCAKLRRGMLNSSAKDLNCNKIALGHHKNDAIETLLMSMFYEGRINCFTPKTYLSRMDVTVIRPMVYIDENEIKSFIKDSNIEIVKNPCPADGKTKRQFIKNLTYNLKAEIPDVQINLLKSLTNIEQLNIWHKEK